MSRHYFGKREIEKKKQAKRLEKQKRREERHAEGPMSQKDMIAYVDEFGNIVDTPPEEQKAATDTVAAELPEKEKEKYKRDFIAGMLLQLACR